MTLTPPLAALEDCFEGVVPAIIATSSADGMPNISYLSHVDLLDERHIALSNQFFGKTVDNLRANPRASVILVDARVGRQFRLDVTWVRNERAGPRFEEMAANLRASSAQIGMADVMRLASIDVFRVEAVTALPAPNPPTEDAPPRADRLAACAEIAGALAEQGDVAALVAALLEGMTARLGCPGVILFQHDPARETLVTIASRGYPASGAGSEVALGVGIAGSAARARRVVKVSDMSRLRRFGAAIRPVAAEEAREIPLPGLPDAQSQIGVPMIARGALVGVIFAESPERLAFGRRAVAALGLLAAQMGALLLALDREAEEGGAASEARAPAAGPLLRVTHHAFDDSVFLDNAYVIKGVAGRILVYLLACHVAEGRVEFTNREIRLAPELRLPDFKDNLETRLLLLRQRLEERGLPVRLTRPGRGRIGLDLAGQPVIERRA